MALEIQLQALGHRLPHESDTFWVEAKGNDRYSLETLLAKFWCPNKPAGASGPAIAIRFTPSA